MTCSKLILVLVGFIFCVQLRSVVLAVEASHTQVEERPYDLYLPLNYSANTNSPKAYPLIVFLHGYSDSSHEVFYMFGTKDMNSYVTQKGIIVAAPNGTIDPHTGNRYWNGDDACCNFFETKVDDVAYIKNVITDVQSKYNVDSSRIFLFGHSNGAFMSYRFACDAPERISGIIPFAGAVWADQTKCKPSQPLKVSVLTIHGTGDSTIYYDGGFIAPVINNTLIYNRSYPSTNQTVSLFNRLNNCNGPISFGNSLSLVTDNDTIPLIFNGCESDSDPAERIINFLWSIKGASHVPTWKSSLFDFIAPVIFNLTKQTVNPDLNPSKDSLDKDLQKFNFIGGILLLFVIAVVVFFISRGKNYNTNRNYSNVNLA